MPLRGSRGSPDSKPKPKPANQWATREQTQTKNNKVRSKGFWGSYVEPCACPACSHKNYDCREVSEPPGNSLGKLEALDDDEIAEYTVFIDELTSLIEFTGNDLLDTVMRKNRCYLKPLH
jgi:hypothetical protein